MADTRFHKEDIPPALLDYFMLHEGRVKWAATSPANSRTFRSRRAPWGEPAGGRRVIGRGKLVTFAGCALLTSDLRFALERGEWPWQVTGSTTYEPGADDADALAIARQRWQLAGDVLTWRIDRGFTSTGEPQYRAGEPVTGFAMSGFQDRMISTGGFGFIRADVVHALKHGAWPWQSGDDWD